jgi:plasmid stabilization system protein ParE
LLKYTVIFTPEAEEQLAALYRYIAAEASPNITERYTSAIVSYCEGLGAFPINVSAVMTYGKVCELPTTKDEP